MEQNKQDLLETISANTISFRVKSWIDNFMTNLPVVHGRYGIASLLDTLQGVPVIIVGAGPTLDRNIKQMRGLEKKACIISCDSTLKALIENGIIPHIVLTTDSKARVKDFIEGVDISEMCFVVDTFTHPDTANLLTEEAGRVYWYNTLPVNNCPFTGALNSWTGFIGNLGTGGCVATSAWWFATQMLGASPDILVGLPEAFYDPAEMYASAVTKTIETEPYTTKPVRDIDIFGEPCWTFPALQSFAFWFQDIFMQLPGIHVNCSEGGILKENILNMPLQKAIELFMQDDHNINELLFVKEATADMVIAGVTKVDLSAHRPLITILLDGPSLPNLALRMGVEEAALHNTINQIRESGLDIDEGFNILENAEGGHEQVTTFRLKGYIDEQGARRDLCQGGQQDSPGQEHQGTERQADDLVLDTDSPAQPEVEQVFSLDGQPDNS